MRKFTNREKRLLILLSIVFIACLADYIYRFWQYEITVETEHYIIYSTATAEQTQKIADIAEILYDSYQQLMENLGCNIISHSRLKVKLYRNRREFRRCNKVTNWVEGFYREPYCYQYYSDDEVNPYHWMLHEATHQLNNEAAKLTLSKWLDEGLATYTSTSVIADGSLHLGKIDYYTYPVWWLDSLELSGDLEKDKSNTAVIPLESIITGRDGPSLNDYFNLYYIHWWSVTHFLIHYDNGRYIPGLAKLLQYGDSLANFEKYIGDVDIVEKQWYEYLCQL